MLLRYVLKPLGSLVSDEPPVVIQIRRIHNLIVRSQSTTLPGLLVTQGFISTERLPCFLSRFGYPLTKPFLASEKIAEQAFYKIILCWKTKSTDCRIVFCVVAGCEDQKSLSTSALSRLENLVTSKFRSTIELAAVSPICSPLHVTLSRQRF